MNCDPGRPSTWIRFTHGKLCEGCTAACCSLPVEVSADDLVRLGKMTVDEAQGSLKKVYRRLHAEGVVRSFMASTGIFTLEQRAGVYCVFLHPETRQCTVYERRPNVCRDFPKVGPRPGYCPKQTLRKPASNGARP